MQYWFFDFDEMKPGESSLGGVSPYSMVKIWDEKYGIVRKLTCNEIDVDRFIFIGWDFLPGDSSPGILILFHVRYGKFTKA